MNNTTVRNAYYIMHKLENILHILYPRVTFYHCTHVYTVRVSARYLKFFFMNDKYFGIHPILTVEPIGKFTTVTNNIFKIIAIKCI